LNHIEEEFVAGDPQIFPVGVANRPLRSGLAAYAQWSVAKQILPSVFLPALLQ
jgi:hypothetical protein